MLTEGQSQQTLIKSHLYNTYLQRPRDSRGKSVVVVGQFEQFDQEEQTNQCQNVQCHSSR